ncbi:hypothetical protein HYX16_02930 [Candidatus Woesearchaeota archaeon]|nr:hypothetical protein [Candidatus Woesearchaeota archaeon]
MQKHSQVYGSQIGIWHFDDLKDEPLGRLLCAGYDCGGGLVGSDILGDDARFFGVRQQKNSSTQTSGKSLTKKGKEMISLSLEEILKLSEGLIPEYAQEEFKKRLEQRYKTQSS